MLERIVERFDVALIRNVDCRPRFSVAFHLNVNEKSDVGSVCEVPLVESATLPPAIDLAGNKADGVEPIETVIRVNGSKLVAVVKTRYPLGEVVVPHYALALR